MLTKQKAFDIVAKHLFAQGRQSDSEDGSTCMYRSPDGLKCAIGVLIPDAEYRPDFEKKDVMDIIREVPSIRHLNEHFLNSLQKVHDSTLSWRSDATMQEYLRGVARTYRVKMSALAGLSFNRGDHA